jgi:hypothetical protein
MEINKRKAKLLRSGIILLIGDLVKYGDEKVVRVNK